MNIKGFISNIIPNNDVKAVDNIGRAIKSDQTNDRDANGQESYSQQQGEQHPPMTDEQLERAMEHLRKLPATKEHKWTIELQNSEDGRFVLVKDNLGTMIRRIPESDLWSLPTDDSPRGQLFKRSA